MPTLDKAGQGHAEATGTTTQQVYVPKNGWFSVGHSHVRTREDEEEKGQGGTGSRRKEGGLYRGMTLGKGQG